MSSFSKIVAPGLRVGWLIAAPSIINRISVVKQIADAHTSSLDQAIVHAYLESGRLPASVERARRAYAERSRWLAQATHSCLPTGLVEFEPPAGGMFLPFFASPPPDQHLRLSYSAVTEESVVEAVGRLAAALEPRTAS